jgi:Uri superfamily endonuclease
MQGLEWLKWQYLYQILLKTAHLLQKKIEGGIYYGDLIRLLGSAAELYDTTKQKYDWHKDYLYVKKRIQGRTTTQRQTENKATKKT